MEQAISHFLDNKLASAQFQNETVDCGAKFKDISLGQDTTKYKRKLRTREKIEKLCDDGAKNYPAYLKLVHTGDSDFSDDETITERLKSKKGAEVEENVEEEINTHEEEVLDRCRVQKKEGSRLIEIKLKQIKINDKMLKKKKSLDLNFEEAGKEKLGLTPEKEKSFSTPNTPYGFRSWYGKYLALCSLSPRSNMAGDIRSSRNGCRLGPLFGCDVQGCLQWKKISRGDIRIQHFISM